MRKIFERPDTTPDRVPPAALTFLPENRIPAPFLSTPFGKVLAEVTRNSTIDVRVRMIIDPLPLSLIPLGNILSDPNTGKANQTVLIGSPSDSVSARSGTNDNGESRSSSTSFISACCRQ